MLESALALSEGMGAPRVHVHGWDGDLLLLEDPCEPERDVGALLRARQHVVAKSANPSGELKSPEDFWPVSSPDGGTALAMVPGVSGPGLVALHDFADAVAERFGLSEQERSQVAERWWFRDETSGRTYIFVPSRELHEKGGGTVSAGDTIDSTAWMFGSRRHPPRQ
jgi:hypothetical protein